MNSELLSTNFSSLTLSYVLDSIWKETIGNGRGNMCLCILLGHNYVSSLCVILHPTISLDLDLPSSSCQYFSISSKLSPEIRLDECKVRNSPFNLKKGNLLDYYKIITNSPTQKTSGFTYWLKSFSKLLPSGDSFRNCSSHTADLLMDNL